MARVTVETVDHVARLARLTLTDDERRTFAAQLDEILSYAEQLAALDVSGVEPMTHVGVREALRDDEPRASLPRDEAQAPAPDANGGFFRVPRVL
jgi:aspartyl-tRNA(Asn)/glutamyl-tRNA(Gln) amidotransferase subunit C